MQCIIEFCKCILCSHRRIPWKPLQCLPRDPDVAAHDRDASCDEAEDPSDSDAEIRNIIRDLQPFHDQEEGPVSDRSFGTHFYVRARGTGETYGWASAMHGESYGAFACSHCRDFVGMYGANLSKTFNEATHTPEGSLMLSKEWCRKQEHFFCIWAAAGSPRDLDLSEYEYSENAEFSEWADGVTTRRTIEAIRVLRAWAPALSGDPR